MSLHRPRANESEDSFARRPNHDPLLQQTTRTPRLPADNNTSAAFKRSSIVSATSSGGRRSSGSADSTGKVSRPSALPRSTSTTSQARLSFIASTRPMPTFPGKSPPLQALAATRVNTYSKHPRVDTSHLQTTCATTQSAAIVSPLDLEDDSILGIALPEKRLPRTQALLPPRLIPELQALAASTNRVPPPPSSSISSISSPSTLFTASPSPWSASTTTTTPISWSSASPGIIQATHSALSSKRSQTVPIPANVRTRLPKLPSLKENITSSKASLRPSNQEPTKLQKKDKKRTPGNSPAPTPPPRSSSVKRSRSRSDSNASRNEVQIEIGEKPSVPPLPLDHSSGIGQESEAGRFEVDSRSGQGHSRLQEAINAAPPRPSREGTTRIGIRQNELVSNTIINGARQRQLLDAAPISQRSHERTTSKEHVRKLSHSENEGVKQSARSRLAKFSKFALFGRSKDSSENDDKTSKGQNRKGPAAGTGHEGYGKFVKRGRKSSIGSSAAGSDSEASIVAVNRRPLPRRQSQASQSQSDLDEFASARLKPVVMRGGSHKSGSSPPRGYQSDAQRSDIKISAVRSPPVPQGIDENAKQRREDIMAPSNDRPTLATRRSQRFNLQDAEFRFPERIETQNLNATPCLDSRNTTQSSDLPTPLSDTPRNEQDASDKYAKRSKRIKWGNLFRRKESISEELPPPIVYDNMESGMQVNISAGPASRSLPFYAMLESEPEITTTAAIGEILREATNSPTGDGSRTSDVSDEELKYDGNQRPVSVLLPSAPVRRFDVPEPDQYGLTQQTQMLPPAPNTLPQKVPRRQPRLAQVGRIPKVVHSNANETVPGIPATARPIAAPESQVSVVGNARSQPSQTSGVLQQHTSKGQPPPRSAAVVESPPVAKIRPQQPRKQSEAEFLQFSDARNSDFTTTSSSSDGLISIMGPVLTNTAPISIPAEHHYDGEDEIWNEYDDFIDHVMSPPQFLKSIKKAQGLRTHEIVASGTNKLKNKGKVQGLAIVPAKVPSSRPSKQQLGSGPSLMSLSPPLQQMASQEEIRLRRSRIAAALHTSSHASLHPSSPYSIREIISEYGRPASSQFSDRLSTSSAGATGPSSTVKAESSLEVLQPKQYENAARMDDVERTKDAVKKHEQSYASLMVSRWLSFGRVLFSPAHDIVQANSLKHVLVIDGLGSEDWSIYCAVTYSAQTTYVYDLKEKGSRQGGGRSARSKEEVPPNHRRNEIATFNDKFPYPPDFFTAIVVRFPPTMADSKLRNIIAESRRVLAPGGYLELMVMDLDIVNMGVQTRRAIKELKIRMTGANRDVSLKPIIDNVQTVLGARGFTNLSRCVVGVPVVGKPSGSTDSSSESRSSGGSLSHHRRSSEPKPFGSMGAPSNFSLTDLLADPSDKADAKIGRMVSRTARSWWQHCFEATVISDGKLSKSVFANKEILAECKSRASSFKMLIAYTQKPGLTDMSTRRRTMSEPTVPTLAVAGTSRTKRLMEKQLEKS